MTKDTRELVAATIGLSLVVVGLVVAVLTFETTTIGAFLGSVVPMTIGAVVLMLRHWIVELVSHDSGQSEVRTST